MGNRRAGKFLAAAMSVALLTGGVIRPFESAGVCG